MREHKYRAWDKRNNKILTPEELSFNSLFLNPETGLFVQISEGTTEDNPIDIIEQPDLIPLQYTGLKDKNGREIFEGDIVKQRPILCDEEKIGVTSIRPTQGVCFSNYPYFTTPCEILGNIYENPDLLEGKG